MAIREFTKTTTNVGGTIGLTIPNWICKAEGITKFQKVRVLIEPIRSNDTKDAFSILGILQDSQAGMDA